MDDLENYCYQLYMSQGMSDFRASGGNYDTMLDWFQTTLYTRVLTNTTKRMKKHPFCGARFSIKIWIKISTIPSLLSK